MNRSQRKYLERQRQRQAKQVDNRRKEWNDWVEKMYCAYLKETKIPAGAAILCHEKEEVHEKKVIDKYWFEHHEERAKIIDTHPDIEYMFGVVQDLVRGYEKLDYDDHRTDMRPLTEEALEPIIKGLNLLQELMKKYKEASEEEIPELKKLEEKVNDE